MRQVLGILTVGFLSVVSWQAIGAGAASGKQHEGRNSGSKAKQVAGPSSSWTGPFSLQVDGQHLVFVNPAERGPDSVLGRLDLGATPVQVVRNGRYVYAACRTHGVAVVDATDPKAPRRVRTLARGLDVVGLRLADGLLILSVARYEVQLFSVEDPADPRALRGGDLGAAAPVPAPGRKRPIVSKSAEGSGRRVAGATQLRGSGRAVSHRPRRGGGRLGQRRSRRRRIEGEVLKVRREEVLLNRGLEDGLAVGDHVAILSPKQIKVFDPIRGTHKKVVTWEPVAVLEVAYVAKDWARASLGRGDHAAKGNRFYTTEGRLTNNIRFPKRVGGMWQIRFGVSPVIGVNTRAFSLMSFSSLAYQFRKPFKIEVAVSPFVAVMGKPHSAAAGNTILTGAYSSRFFSIGFGGGYQGVQGGRSGFVIAQTLRLGCMDGLNLLFTNQLVLSDDNKDKERRFMVGSISGEINIPLVSRVTLFLSGGGGSQRYAYGDVGIRTYVRGVGGPGTIIISSSLGMAYVVSRWTVINDAGRRAYEETGGVGVDFSIGVDFRL